MTKRGKKTLHSYFPQQSKTQGHCSPSPSNVENEIGVILTDSPQNGSPQLQEPEANLGGISRANPTPQTRTRQRESQFDINSLPHDPARRKRILDYHPDDYVAVRSAYIQIGACRPKMERTDFPQTQIGDHPEVIMNDGHAAFVKSGFRGWNRPGALMKHVGKVGSVHNACKEKFDDFGDPSVNIETCFEEHTLASSKEYKTCLTASLDCLRYLLCQGLAFRGHDESETSLNKGNFLELLNWYAKRNKDVKKVVLEKPPANNQMVSPKIQKDLINSCSKEVTQAIIDELDGDYFGILVDESSDVSQKEQMAFCLRYVNKGGAVVERFLGVEHVKDTTAVTLKDTIYSIIAQYSLSSSKICGQDYDGANNMKGESNRLKILIMRDTPCAYYIHCFAHQLQLALVAVSKKSVDCGWLFETLSNLLNLVGSSCKRHEMLRETQVQKVEKALEDEELETGKGLNQELGLGRLGYTRWGSHYKLLSNVIVLYPTLREVLDMIFENPLTPDDKAKYDGLSFAIESFDFVFMLLLMKVILGVENELNIALQQKNLDIVRAMSLVRLTKERLQSMREEGWEQLLSSIISFCEKNDIQVPHMIDEYFPRGREKRGKVHTTNLHHFRVEVFFAIIDLQLQELDNRFDEFHPAEFSIVDLLYLEDELDNYIFDVRRDDKFRDLKGIGFP